MLLNHDFSPFTIYFCNWGTKICNLSTKAPLSYLFKTIALYLVSIQC